jgi:hypothetical protein
MVKAPRERAWGTDDVRRKGGDFFSASKESRPSASEAPARRLPSRRPRRSDMAAAARMAEAAEAARVAEADWAGEVARVARTAEAARIAKTTDAPVTSKAANEVRRSPGRHRRMLRLLSHSPGSGEDRIR